MFGVRTIARSLLAATFVAGGLEALRKSQQLAPLAEDVADTLGLDQDTETLVKVNAGVQVAGGALFALGVMPRITGLVLATSLIPTTLVGHRFWETEEREERGEQTTQFLKNAGLLGGLLFAALDTGGRPSVFWSGKRAVAGAGESVAATARSVADAVSPS